MKKHLIISIILISSFNCTAQEYSIGAETGLHYDFISVIYEHYKCGQAFTGWDMGSITFSSLQAEPFAQTAHLVLADTQSNAEKPKELFSQLLKDREYILLNQID